MSWESYEKQYTDDPRSAFKAGFLALIVVSIALWVLGTMCSAANQTASVVGQQFGPAAIVVKYEWFKDAAAMLQKKQADIGLYERRMKRCEGSQPKDVRERCAIWDSEFLGVVASYNQLAAEYNSNMSKVNWQFASASVPREVAAYNNGVK